MVGRLSDWARDGAIVRLATTPSPAARRSRADRHATYKVIEQHNDPEEGALFGAEPAIVVHRQEVQKVRERHDERQQKAAHRERQPAPLGYRNGEHQAPQRAPEDSLIPPALNTRSRGSVIWQLERESERASARERDIQA